MPDDPAPLVSPPLNLLEYEAVARSLLDRMAFDYIAGGAMDEVTVRANRAAFDQWRIVPHVLRGITGCDLATTVVGQEIALPVMLAPVGFQRLAHPEGELASARAARASGTIYTMSTAANFTIEEIASQAGRWWFQLYVYQDRAITRDLIQRAAAAGAAALVVTVDTPRLGRREADERNHFTLPPGLTVANFVRRDQQSMPSLDQGSGLAAYTTSSFEPSLSWQDLEWVASQTTLPLILKGILAADDARRAFAQGARAIIVSNHGGRQLDGAVATLDALPAIADAVGDQGEILLDGGIRRGTDVLKALALGARAVLIGRPYAWGLAVAGEAGVRRVLDLLRAEIELGLWLAGVPKATEVPRALVVPTGPMLP